MVMDLVIDRSNGTEDTLRHSKTMLSKVINGDELTLDKKCSVKIMTIMNSFQEPQVLPQQWFISVKDGTP
jgi:hypothetical protein